MNPLAVLLPALHTALTSPALVWDEVPVPVKDYFPLSQAGHYVEIDQPTDNDAGGGTRCRQYNLTVLLNVVTQFPGIALSRLPAESLASQINERLRGQRLDLPAPWDCGPGQLSAIQLKERPDQLLSIRRLLRYSWVLTYHAAAAPPEPAVGRGFDYVFAGPDGGFVLA